MRNQYLAVYLVLLPGNLKGTENHPPLFKNILQLKISLATTGIRGGPQSCVWGVFRAVCEEDSELCEGRTQSCVRGGLSCVWEEDSELCVEDLALCVWRT